MNMLARCTLLAGLLLSPASASPQVTAVYRQVEGGYRVSFNVTAGDYTVYRWGFQRIDPFGLTSPDGWYATVFTRYTDWMAVSGNDELLPGGTLVGCGATFPQLPTQIDYFVMQRAVPSACYGTVAPIPIPEPSSLLALGIGGIGVLGAALRRRVRGTG